MVSSESGCHLPRRGNIPANFFDEVVLSNSYFSDGRLIVQINFRQEPIRERGQTDGMLKTSTR